MASLNKDIPILTQEIEGQTITCSAGLEFDKTKPPKHPTVVTHLGRFHSDEVMGIALLLLGPLRGQKRVHVIRNRDNRWADIGNYVVDVGQIYDPEINRFDHHQKNFDISYPDGSSYASSGLVWLKYGHEIVTELAKTVSEDIDMVDTVDYVYERIATLIKKVDNSDNGQQLDESYANPIGGWVTNMNPVRVNGSNMAEQYNQNFLYTLTGTLMWLRNRIMSLLSIHIGSVYLEEAIRSSNSTEYLFLPYDIPWKEMLWDKWELFDKYQLIVSADREDTGWAVYSLPIQPSQIYSIRCPIPKKLCGLSGPKLEQLTGISDLTFCHRNGFVMYAKTKESAIAVAQYILMHRNTQIK